eukprot:scaffold43046_cov45-Phaeocystis_antarctica.AAC.1
MRGLLEAQPLTDDALVAPGEPVGELGNPLDVRREADATKCFIEAEEEVAHLGGRGGVVREARERGW